MILMKNKVRNKVWVQVENKCQKQSKVFYADLIWNIRDRLTDELDVQVAIRDYLREQNVVQI